MSDTGDHLFRALCLLGSAVTVALACLLPINMLVPIVTALTAWACASVPIGVLVGYCALGEE